MATKKTVWVADGSKDEFATESEAIHWERVLFTAERLRGIASGLTEKDRRAIAAWTLTHFVPKSSDGPQAAYPPKVHGPGAPQPYAQPQPPAPANQHSGNCTCANCVPKSSDSPQAAYPPAPSAVPPAPKHPVGACNCGGVGYYDASRHDDTCPYRASYGQ